MWLFANPGSVNCPGNCEAILRIAVQMDECIPKRYMKDSGRVSCG